MSRHRNVRSMRYSDGVSTPKNRCEREKRLISLIGLSTQSDNNPYDGDRMEDELDNSLEGDRMDHEMSFGEAEKYVPVNIKEEVMSDYNSSTYKVGGQDESNTSECSSWTPAPQKNLAHKKSIRKEYDGYDDVYGHSVEEDYAMSPSDAAFMYDRNNSQHQMSSFLKEDEDIAEEDESAYSQMDQIDKAKLASCVSQIKSVLNDTVSEQEIIDTVLAEKFEVSAALNKLLEKITKNNAGGAPDLQKQDRTRLMRGRTAQIIEQNKATVVTIVSSPSKNNVVLGFQVPDSDTNPENSRPPSGSQTPRSASPSVQTTSNSRNTTDTLFKQSNRNYAKAEEQFKTDRGDLKEQLHMVVIGHVDAGKSTLMGHVLFKLGHVSSKTMHKYEQESKKIGKQSFIYAWILDETGEERSRGITMDVGQSKFETKTKMVTLLDAPGHKDFIPNMITGASQADVALLVVDSTRGEFETGFESGGQTREHALLVRSLGVSQLCVAVNKLDTCGWNEERFREISFKLGSFLKQAGFKERDVAFVPCSGLTGENLTEKSTNAELLKWYDGPTLLEVIDRFKCPVRPVSKPLRISVSDVFKGTGSGFCISGRVETGMVQTGDKILVLPQNEIGTIKALSIDDMPSQSAYAGDSVSVTLANYDIENMSIGYVLCDPAFPVPVTSKFEARIVIFNVTVPITRGYPIVLHIQCLSEQAVITKLVSQLNKSTGDVIKRKPRCLLKNNNALVVIETTRPICVELYRDMKELGRFMLRVGGVTIAAGLITQILS